MNLIVTKADLPYPEVIIDTPSRHDVQCLMGDYAGAQSETTAIFQYVYQAYVNQDNEEYHRLFESIAVTEMHHHELLGETICKLGGNPVIADGREFWSGRNINYTCGLRQMLVADIRAEQQAIRNYRKSIECLDNYTIKELIERIILDEQMHIELLSAALDKLDKD